MRHISGLSRFAAIVFALLVSAQATAQGVADLSNKETSSGLKEALSRGAEMAVSQLGKPNGFMGDARVKIPLPESLQGAEKMMRKLGMKKQADKLIETMNRAAESAVVEARPILINAVKNMSFDDAKAILTGGEDAAPSISGAAPRHRSVKNSCPSSSRPPPRCNSPTSTTSTPARPPAWG